MTPNALIKCPKFERCNAPLCPLYRDIGSHIRGEPVCAYLLELVKPGGRERLVELLPPETAAEILSAAPELTGNDSPLRIQLLRAAKQASKIEASRRLTAARGPTGPCEQTLGGAHDAR